MYAIPSPSGKMMTNGVILMLTKEQWEKIEKTLTLPFSSVKLRCDGHEVTARVEISKNKLVVTVYVDGWFKGEWMNIENELGKKFYPQRTRFLFKPLERKEALKLSKKRYIGKELRELCRKQYETKYSYLMPYFASAKLFCRHIRKTCQSIELTSEML